MKKLFILLLVLVLVLFVSGCSDTLVGEVLGPGPICPNSCDDGDHCTKDYCSASTAFECEHTRVCYSCENDNDCPENNPYRLGGPYCLRGECKIYECESDEDCPEHKKYCLKYGYKCSKHECTSDYDCSEDKPYCITSSGTYYCADYECETDDDCYDLYLLKKGKCLDNRCVDCIGNFDCLTCKDKWHCGTYVCSDNTCRKCRFDHECDLGYCSISGLCAV